MPQSLNVPAIRVIGGMGECPSRLSTGRNLQIGIERPKMTQGSCRMQRGDAGAIETILLRRKDPAMERV